jgi:putative ABC transport system ATP-binding protein
MNKEKGVTVVCNTHDLKIIKASDRIVWIRDGRIDKIERKDEIQVQVGTMKTAGGEVH